MPGATEPLLREKAPPLSQAAMGVRIMTRIWGALMSAGLAAMVLRSFRAPERSHWNEDMQEFFLRSFVSNNTIASHSLSLTREPHIAGTPENMQTAQYVYDKLQEYGVENVHFADYPVLLSYPVSLQLFLQYPVKQNLTHREPTFEEDPYSSNAKVTDLFLGYSASGDVTGEVVFANYGRTEDFDALHSLGVNCTGKIVLMRYGLIFRGDKVKAASVAGAVGAILFSDPMIVAPEGVDPAHVYPNAKWLPPAGSQRGSIFDYAGDPATPGWPSSDGGERLSKEAVEEILPKIPAMPIGYEDAQPILATLGGQKAPADWWDGILKTSRGVGPGPAVVRMAVKMDNAVRTIRNVIGYIPGTQEPDRYVILGNHRDAWTFGAADPNSGTSSLLAVAESLNQLVRKGWKPRRTLVLCSWDAEEYALIGSTEWVESNEQLLGSRAVAYLNVDVAVSGPGFDAAASPQLDSLVQEVTALVSDPDAEGRRVYDSWLELSQRQSPGLGSPEVGRLGGAGSDYAGFLQHVGVSAFDMGFGAEEAHYYPVYHSVFDNYHWMSKFGDPGFKRHVACAQIWGLLALRLADDPLLPFSYQRYGEELTLYASSLEPLVANSASLEPIWKALGKFQRATASLALELQAVKKLGKSQWWESEKGRETRELNDRMMMAERAMLDPMGTSKAAWYRHMVYAPASDNDYSSTAFPGVAGALTEYRASPSTASLAKLQHEIFRVARAIERSAIVLEGHLH